MTGYPEAPEPVYKEAPIDNARCPNCGNEEGLTRTERANKHTQPIPPDHPAGNCPECEETFDTYAAHHEYKWARMSEEEREEYRRQREKFEGKMTAWQESAEYHHQQREP